MVEYNVDGLRLEFEAWYLGLCPDYTFRNLRRRKNNPDKYYYKAVNEMWRLYRDNHTLAIVEEPEPEDVSESFQTQVVRQLNIKCGTVNADARKWDLLEQTIKLLMALNAGREDCITVINETYQDVRDPVYTSMGGTLISLVGLSQAQGMDLVKCGEIQLRRLCEKHNVDLK